jgi:hypothetical protein
MLLSTCWALRQDQAAIDTWSSWLLLVGMVSATDGKARVLFSDATAAAAVDRMP